MSQPPRIQGHFSGFVKAPESSVMQLIIEVPVREAQRVIDALGYPLPSKEVILAISHLSHKAKKPPLRHDQSGEVNRATRAVLLSHDTQFHKFLMTSVANKWLQLFHSWKDSHTAASAYLRERCDIDNITELNSNPTAADEFEFIYRQFRNWQQYVQGAEHRRKVMTPEIHKKYNELQQIIKLLAPSLEIYRMMDFSEFPDHARPFANGTMSIFAAHHMSLRDIHTTQENLKKAIKIVWLMDQLISELVTDQEKEAA